MQSVKNLIIGTGFSGATLAYKIANELHEEVFIIDSKDHLAGNCYDFQNEQGIYIHQYGTHIFHTNSKPVWDFVSRFTEWFPYMHKVKGNVDGNEIPIPFNLNSLYQVFPPTLAQNLEQKLLQRFEFGQKIPILELKKQQDPDLDLLANFIYEKVFLHYTLKQWGVRPEELDPSVTARVPIYISKDDRYFQDRYQGIPMDGYTSIVEKMLDHPLITVKLNTSFQSIKKQITYDRLFCSGPIDEFYDYELGELPYRSLRFQFVELNKPYFQSAAVINYPNNYDFTRIGEYKYFLDTQSTSTVISFEYPEPYHRGTNERYYPIINEQNQKLYQLYRAKTTSSPNIHFFGRLGDYKYYDMDKAIERSLELFESIKNN